MVLRVVKLLQLLSVSVQAILLQCFTKISTIFAMFIFLNLTQYSSPHASSCYQEHKHIRLTLPAVRQGRISITYL